jgi:hypothetical protein
MLHKIINNFSIKVRREVVAVCLLVITSITYGQVVILERSTWRGKTSSGTEYQFEFMPNGILKYSNWNGQTVATFDNARWQLNSNQLSIDFNNGFANWQGVVTGDNASGTANNKKGNTWTWDFKKINVALEQPFEQLVKKSPPNPTPTSAQGSTNVAQPVPTQPQLATQTQNTNLASNQNTFVNNEFEIVRGFLNRKIDWIFAIRNKDNFPVYFSPQEIYITRNKELIVNALIQFEKHHDGGISSIFTLKVSDCFSNDLPSFTRIRHRYFSEINGKGVVIKDNVINEETITLESWSVRGLVWHTIATKACVKAKEITENNLQKYETVQRQLSVLNTQAGIELYKKYQAEDERNTKEIRLALEDKSKREKDAQERARNKALEGKLLFDGLVNILNTGTLTGSCQGVFSHLAIQTNKLYAHTISKPAKNQDDEFRNRKEADQYLRAGELGGILSNRIANSSSKNVPPSEQSDYFQSVNESMYKMQNLNDAKIAYQAYNYCRNKF